ncbi:hypothetical protein [Pseudomonas sp. GV047]|uniref:hypothetical protein n=1 Tax=Pseudomonas sp. GV047 TaxID=2135751 RepID=UPI000D3D8692|nr:hypothetical protein [Pseudomonas sp. GV047]PUB43208.1 hypothetical protein C8K58_10790 [Pseudomonas sp. GV047]
MNDFRDLKAIAEACEQHQPLRFMRSHGALYIRNDKGIVFDVHQNRSFPGVMAQNKDYADLVLAANPAAILALIAENEAMAGMLQRFVDGEHDQDENQAERHMYFTEAQSLLALVSGELEAHTIVPDSAIKAIHAERDQLKAENDTLREEVALDDKLIADRDRLLNMFECPVHGQCIPFAMDQVEALRKDAKRLQSAIDFVQKLRDAAGNQPSVATGYLHDILSAMGKDERP